MAQVASAVLFFSVASLMVSLVGTLDASPHICQCICNILQRASHLRYRCKLVKVYADLSCRKFHLPRQLEMQLVLEAWMQPVLEA